MRPCLLSLLCSLLAIASMAAPATAQELYDDSQLETLELSFVESNRWTLLESHWTAGNGLLLAGDLTCEGVTKPVLQRFMSVPEVRERDIAHLRTMLESFSWTELGPTPISLLGPNQGQLSFGDGCRCVGGRVTSLHPVIVSSSVENYELAVDYTELPASAGLAVAIRRLFQCWFRDAAVLGTGFNLSGGLSLNSTP